jgi:hypothetical protein
MAPSESNPKPPVEVREAVAAHYERRGRRADVEGFGAMGAMCQLYAAKARAGHSNPLTRRVERIMRGHVTRYDMMPVGQQVDMLHLMARG